MSDRYIVIPKWDGPDGFQHYKNRDPIWIKTYTRLISDDAFRKLTYHQRGLLLSIWLEYARGNRQLSDSTLILTRQLGQRVLTRDLEALNHAGFIDFAASAPLAPRYQPASPEVEVREEKALSSKAGATPPPDPYRFRCTECTVKAKTERELRDHLDNVHWLEGDPLDQAVAQAVREAGTA